MLGTIAKQCFAYSVLVFAAVIPTIASAESSVEAAVRAYFADIPVMVEIARCESGFRQFDAGGNVLDGGAGGMIGVLQISYAVHADEASLRGWDIRTLEGNLNYARHLYELEGTDPWISAYPCWGKVALSQTLVAPKETAIETFTPASLAGELRIDLTFGMEHPEVVTPQRLLNQAGFTLADSGPGSPGNETTKFGALTRSAVRKFQCAKGIACAGDEYKTSYGLVESRTWAALLGTNTQTESRPVAEVALKPAVAADVPGDMKSLENQIAELTKIVAELQLKLGMFTTAAQR